MKVSPELLKQLNEMLDAYTQDVKNSGLKPSTEKTYLLHANHFVRWCNGDFVPGARLKESGK
ncbi:hypothetical protein [Paenibacillus sp. BIC5C1]|uniref:hypothetical protein n=1 Tax=Paenibacillus sp. BIC5C1 TaxID=3078263 RepID=UPI0028EC27DC|nr:hypothetical protein [Paenibacillus sp. BIC5C1]